MRSALAAGYRPPCRVVGGGLSLAEAEKERERVSLSLLEKREKVK